MTWLNRTSEKKNYYPEVSWIVDGDVHKLYTVENGMPKPLFDPEDTIMKVRYWEQDNERYISGSTPDGHCFVQKLNVYEGDPNKESLNNVAREEIKPLKTFDPNIAKQAEPEDIRRFRLAQESAMAIYLLRRKEYENNLDIDRRFPLYNSSGLYQKAVRVILDIEERRELKEDTLLDMSNYSNMIRATRGEAD